jgi:hypothetical protein
MKKILVMLFSLSFVISCNIRIEKRLYNRGYYIETSTKKHQASDKGNYLTRNDTLSDQQKPAADNVETVQHNPVIHQNSPTQKIRNDEKKWMDSNQPDKVFSEKLVGEKNIHPVQLKDVRKIKSTQSSTTSTGFRDDAYLIALAAMMGLTVFGLFRLLKKTTLKVTRWSNKNKIKAKFLITGIQVVMGILGIMIGKDLHAIGYSFSDSLEYIGGSIIGLLLLSAVISKRKNQLVLFGSSSFYLRKLGHLAVAMGFFMVTVGIGNKLADHKEQISPLGYGVEQIDDAIDHDSNISDTNDRKPNTNGRGGLLALWIILYIIMAAGLIVLTCYLFCTGLTGVGIVMVIITLALMVVIAWLMARWVWRGKQPEQPKENKQTNKKGWPGWYIPVYILMVLVLIGLIVVSWLFGWLYAGIPVTIIAIALIALVPYLMAKKAKELKEQR